MEIKLKHHNVLGSKEYPEEQHYSPRDCYTSNEGHLVIRLENADGRVSITLDQEALQVLKRAMLDNQRLQPDRGYREGFVTDTAGPDGYIGVHAPSPDYEREQGLPLPEDPES